MAEDPGGVVAAFDCWLGEGFIFEVVDEIEGHSSGCGD